MNSPPKILLVSRCTWTLFTFRRNLIRTLIESGADVAVAASTDDPYAGRVRDLGVNVFDLPIKSRSLNPFREIFLLRSMIACYRSFEPDIVHHFTIKPVIFGSMAARLAGIPTVINTITGLGYAFTEGGWLLEKITTFLYRISVPQSQHVFFQNGEDMHLFLERRIVRRDNCSLVAGSGVDLELYKSERPAAQGTAPVAFLFIGRILRDKGIHEFVAAVNAARQAGISARFFVVGGTDVANRSSVSEEDFLRIAEQAGITWLGHVDDVKAVIETADVVVLPSYREGTPRSLLEAASMGRAIITTDAVGCRNVVDDGENGILVPIKSVQALTEAFVYLAGDRETIARMGRAGRRKVEQEFSEATVIDATINQYKLKRDERSE